MTRQKKLAASQRVLAAAYAYLFLPFALFAVGWLKIWLALPVLALMGLCFVRMVGHAPVLWLPRWDRKNMLRLAVVVGLVLGWVFFSGIGRYSFQTEDHNVRNAMFRMLVEQSWPIVDLHPPAEFFDGPVALTYYFGFWLPAALVGKLFGLGAGYFAQFVWAVLGILLFYWLVLVLSVQKMRVWPLVVFIFFSGLDWVGASLVRHQWINVITAAPHLDNWPDYFQLTSFSSQLYWVFNQAIVGWLAIGLLAVQKDNRAMVPIIAFALITGTIPAVGLVPLAAYFMIRNWQRDNPLKKWDVLGFVRNALTMENATGALCGLIAYLFLGSNNAGQRFSTLFPLAGDIFWLWLLFVLCESVIFLVLVAKYNYKNPLFYIIGVLFLLLPWLRLGDKADLAMRGTIPAAVILYLMVVGALDQSFREKCWVIFGGLVALLVVGSATAEVEISRSAVRTYKYYRHGDKAMLDQVEWHPMELGWRDNFYGSMDNKFFFTYLMKSVGETTGEK